MAEVISNTKINDYIILGMIKVLEALDEFKKDGVNLSEIDFGKILQCRKRDLADPSILDKCIILKNDGLE